MDIICFSKTHRYSISIYLCKGTNFFWNHKDNELKRLKDWKIEASVEGAKDMRNINSCVMSNNFSDTNLQKLFEHTKKYQSKYVSETRTVTK